MPQLEKGGAMIRHAHRRGALGVEFPIGRVGDVRKLLLRVLVQKELHNAHGAAPVVHFAKGRHLRDLHLRYLRREVESPVRREAVFYGFRGRGPGIEIPCAVVLHQFTIQARKTRLRSGLFLYPRSKRPAARILPSRRSGQVLTSGSGRARAPPRRSASAALRN